jgi:hypothetical protein
MMGGKRQVTSDFQLAGDESEVNQAKEVQLAELAQTGKLAASGTFWNDHAVRMASFAFFLFTVGVENRVDYPLIDLSSLVWNLLGQYLCRPLVALAGFKALTDRSPTLP